MKNHAIGASRLLDNSSGSSPQASAAASAGPTAAATRRRGCRRRRGGVHGGEPENRGKRKFGLDFENSEIDGERDWVLKEGSLAYRDDSRGGPAGSGVAGNRGSNVDWSDSGLEVSGSIGGSADMGE